MLSVVGSGEAVSGWSADAYVDNGFDDRHDAVYNGHEATGDGGHYALELGDRAVSASRACGRGVSLRLRKRRRHPLLRSLRGVLGGSKQGELVAGTVVRLRGLTGLGCEG